MAESRPLALRRQVPALAGTRAKGARLPLKRQKGRTSLETYDPNKNKTEVRQGSPRKMNMRVLVISLIGIIILFAIIYLVFTMSQPNPT
jgi:uncharacterized membrane protein YdbT with pleckstrin-like domain